MKAKLWFRSGLLLLLCALLGSCGTPVPEGSSVPAEESSEAVSIPEDPNARIARAYLEELLEAEWSPDWLTAERAESIRESVKQLKAPFLTEADVLHIAERAVPFYFAVWQEEEKVSLPACGVMAAFAWDPNDYVGTTFDCYTKLLAYTVYLFTPPDDVFREEEVGRKISSDTLATWQGFYLPLAGNYSTRSEVLAVLQEGKNGLTLQLSELAEGEHPLDFRYCEGLSLLRGDGEELPFVLIDLALQGDVALPEGFCAS